MIRNKKAQGLSVSTIIIAILALLVLVVLALIFTGSMDKFVDAIFGKTCEGMGMPKLASVGCGDDEEIYPGYLKDVSAGEVCCIKVS